MSAWTGPAPYTFSPLRSGSGIFYASIGVDRPNAWEFIALDRDGQRTPRTTVRLAIVKPEDEDVCGCKVQPLLDFFRVPPDPVKVRLVELNSAPYAPAT